MNHPDYDAFWKRQGFAPWLNRVTVPMLNVAGWWDQEDFYGPIKIYELLERHDSSEQEFPRRRPVESRRLVERRWAEARSHRLRQHDRGLLPAEGARALPGASSEGQRKSRSSGGADVQDGCKRVGAARRVAAEATTARRLYFQADGKLSFTPPAAGTKAFDSYVSDPANPVPYRPRPITCVGVGNVVG